MKLLFVTFLCCASAYSLTIPDGLVEYGPAIFARTLSDFVVRQLADGIKTGKFVQVVSELDVKASFPLINITLPSLPEPINLLPLDIPVNISVPNFSMEGDFSISSPQVLGQGEIDGSLAVLYDMQTKIAGINLEVQLPTIHIDSMYKMDLVTTFGAGTTGTMTGEGLLSSGFTGFFFKLFAEGAVPLTTGERLSLTALDVDIGFEDIYINLEGGLLNGEPFDLSNVANLLKTVFNLIWTEPYKTQINYVIRCSIDHLINGCPPLDLIGGVYDCLKVELNEACFREPDPTSPTTPTTTKVTVPTSSESTSDQTVSQSSTESLPTDPAGSDSTTSVSDATTPDSTETTTAGASFITNSFSFVFAIMIILCIM